MDSCPEYDLVIGDRVRALPSYGMQYTRIYDLPIISFDKKCRAEISGWGYKVHCRHLVKMDKQKP